MKNVPATFIFRKGFGIRQPYPNPPQIFPDLGRESKQIHRKSEAIFAEEHGAILDRFG